MKPMIAYLRAMGLKLKSKGDIGDYKKKTCDHVTKYIEKPLATTTLDMNYNLLFNSASKDNDRRKLLGVLCTLLIPS